MTWMGWRCVEKKKEEGAGRFLNSTCRYCKERICVDSESSVLTVTWQHK